MGGAFALWVPFSGLTLSLAALAFGFDQTHKWWMLYIYDIAQRQPVQALPFLDLVLAWNRGVSYGWFASHGALGQVVLIAVAVVVSAWLWRWGSQARRRLTAAALGLIIGGALANALDRAEHGAVADFFQLHWGGWSWYIFNIADVAVVAGVALLVYDSFQDKAPRPAEGP